ncbi:shikimate dehydrogenase [Methyloligella sp. 2.7D]|uniref:shikimate dehydrogenase n=1 Tax=unclassified Methyloligella TaxID=2625955 RepID=UPI00157D6BC6|nr:shikimate dehydrogenase [Methyloligella sp. GL2]QKP76277.1 shikimate dehydrogenase [Methyloligella sp. GL2]
MKHASVIGWPIEHSRSPMIHGYWLKRYGIDGAYDKRAVPPEEIETFLGALGKHGLAGANVTIPHKEAALRVADEADEAAKAIGAANTLWLDAAGKLQAANTDAYGFMTALETAAPGFSVKGKTAVLLGAGGAARAILYGLLEAGAGKAIIANRSRDRAEALAQSFGPRVAVVDWDAREDALSGAALLVNTTSLGMTGQPPLSISLEKLPEDAVVADIVYSPLQTELLKTASARGLRTVDGLGMLMHQAVPGFARWFGVRPEVTDELRALLEADLKKEAA